MFITHNSNRVRDILAGHAELWLRPRAISHLYLRLRLLLRGPEANVIMNMRTDTAPFPKWP